MQYGLTNCAAALAVEFSKSAFRPVCVVMVDCYDDLVWTDVRW